MTSTPPDGHRRQRQALNSVVIGVVLALCVGGLVIVGLYLLFAAAMANYGSNK